MESRIKIKSIFIIFAAVLLTGAFITACMKSTEQEDISIEVETDASEVSKKSIESETDTGEALADVNFEDYVNQVNELVKSNWSSMDKVWPAYNYNNHNFLIFYINEEGEVKEARLLNVNESRSLEKNEYENITPPNPEGYDEINFEDKPSIVMSVDDEVMKNENSAEELYKTATHEIVHFYYQKDVKASADSSRSQLYPVEKEPRILRRMLYTRLIQAFENPDKQDEYLGKARFWLDRYNTEFKSEADSIRATDIAEGTARYTENFGMFIGKNLSGEDLRKEADKFIKKEEIFVSADKESYEIGYVAGLILDEIEPDWKESFYAKGRGIPEVLLENISPISDEADKEIEDKVTNEVNTVNENAKDKLKDIIEAKDNTEIPLLHLDVSKGSKSFYAESMFRYQNLSVMAGYSSKFNVDGKEIDIKNMAIISGYEEESQYLRIPLTMKYDIKDGILTIDTEHLRADKIAVTASEEKGRTIYSAQVQD